MRKIFFAALLAAALLAGCEKDPPVGFQPPGLGPPVPEKPARWVTLYPEKSDSLDLNVTQGNIVFNLPDSLRGRRDVRLETFRMKVFVKAVSSFPTPTGLFYGVDVLGVKNGMGEVLHVAAVVTERELPSNITRVVEVSLKGYPTAGASGFRIYFDVVGGYIKIRVLSAEVLIR